jgi:WD40 repeat protein
VKLWDWRLGTEVKTLREHTKPTNNVAYSYDGKTIASCSDDETIKIWSTDLKTRESIMTLIGHNAPVLTVLYSFDSKYLVSSDESGEILVWEMPEGKLLRRIKAHDELIQDVSFAGDNRTIVSASLDKKVKLWDIHTGENLMTFDAGVEIWSVDLVSDASIIIIGCADGTVRFLRKEK